MKRRIQLFCGIFVIGLLCHVKATAQKYPVGITSFQVTPSLFLSDYTTPGSGNIKATLRFSDYNEPSVDVYLRLTIESAGAKLMTSPSFRPAEMFTLIPGEPFTIQDADFTPYFQLQHILCQGVTQTELQRTNRLPEGWYMFTVQVMESNSGKALSLPVSMRAHLALIDPPAPVTPAKGQFINTSTTQITFQWQQNAATTLNRLNIAYYLRLYEIPDRVDPLEAMQNKSAREVSMTDALYGRVYHYGPVDFPLTSGKRYAYTITAQSDDGRKWFKNDGVSEIRWFYYGYPTGGHIPLIYPGNEEALNRQMLQKLEWGASDNLVDDAQPVEYRVKMTALETGEDPISAIDRELEWKHRSPIKVNKSGGHVILSDVESEQRYAWQVSAYTDETEVGKSAIQTFYAPPSIERFVVGGHIIEVSAITNSRLDDLAGKGMVIISTSGEKIPVHFEHLKIVDNDGLMELAGGEIKCSVSGLIDPIPLVPTTEVNGRAICYPDSIRINREGMRIKGRVEWDYPFGTSAKEKSKVLFQPTWFFYNDKYRLEGTPQVVSDQSYKLLEPANFFMQLDNKSYAQVSLNRWTMIFSGRIFVNANVKGALRDAYSIDFDQWKELHYNKVEGYENDNELRLIANTQLNLVPRTVIVDMSETMSPLKFAGQLDWKGIYFENFDVRFIPAVDDRGQLKLNEEVLNNYTLAMSDSCRSWIVGDGFHFRYATPIAEEGVVLFNTFPSKIDLLSLDIQKSAVIRAQLKGSIRIPVISQTDRYAYTVPITGSGFQTGYLDKSLDGLSFAFNEHYPDQKIHARIKRAVFADKSHLDMDLEMQWEKIGVTFSDLQQFCAWGNYEIGFMTPKGVANLTHQVQGIVENYKINVEQLGCGRMCNQYAFAVSTSVVIDEDVAGPKGAPKLNFYSIADNVLLPDDCNLDPQNIETEQLVANEGNFTMTDEGVGEPEDDNTLKEVEALNKKMTEQLSAINGVTETLYRIADAIHYEQTVAGDPHVDTKNYMNTLPSTTPAGGEYSIKEIVAILEVSKMLLDESLHPKIDNWINKLNKFESGAEEINDIIHSFQSGALFAQLVDIVMDQYMPLIFNPISNAKENLKKQIETLVEKYKKQALDQLDKLLLSAAESIKTGAKSGVGFADDSQKAETEINNIISDAVKRIQVEIHYAIDKSITENFTGYFTNFLDTLVDVRITGFVDDMIRTTLKSAVTGNAGSISLNGIKEASLNNLNAIVNDAKELIMPENLLGMLENTGKGIINNFDWKSILADVTVKFVSQQALQYVSRLAPEGLKQVLNSGPAKDVLDNISRNVDIDFDALKSGNLKEVIKFDPSAITIETGVVSASGYAKKIKNDPVYGNGFMAEINATIKVPKPFNAFAKFVNGKQLQDNFNYWYVQFGCKGLGIPMSPIPLVFDGGAGRVFKKMSRPTPQSEYVPDKNNNFGAGISAYFYDQSGGGIAIFDVDFEMNIMEKGFELAMNGDALLGNNINLLGKRGAGSSLDSNTIGGAKEKINVSRSLAKGYGSMGYSSIENIFYAKAGVTMQLSPLLCAGGEFNAYIAPNDWLFSVGTRENPLYAKLLCLDAISMKSWFSLSKSMLDVGLQQNIDLDLRTPWMGFGFAKVRGYAEFLFRFGCEAVVYWKPLRVRDASIYADLRIALGIEYDTWLKSGKVDLIAIAFGGHLIYLSRTKEDLEADRGTPKQVTDYTGNSYSMLSGRLYGSVTVIGIKIGVDFEAKKEWKS
jgi:hypothetical protein